MRNRAKCKLCECIIESFTILDHVTCKCGEIEVWGGNQKLSCAANDFSNFIRVDDEGNEIIVTVKDDVKPLDKVKKLNKSEMLGMLDQMVKSYENLPERALELPATNQDLASVILLLSAILRASD